MMMRWPLVILFALLTVREISAQPDLARFVDEGGEFIEVDGLRTYILQHGPLDGQPVLLLHGFLGSTFDWRLNIDELAAAGFRVIAFDRPPYGLSAKPTDYDFSHVGQAKFTAALLDELGVSRATLVGHSIGANVALHLTIINPDRINRLVLISGTILSDGGPAPALMRLVSSPPFEPLLTNTLRSLPAMVSEDAMPDAVTKRFLAPWDFPGWEEALVNAIKTSTGNLLSEAQLQTISQPTLVIWGENDSLVPVADGERLVDLLPNTTWRPYAGIGHQVMSEAPDQFNHDVIEFLQKVGP